MPPCMAESAKNTPTKNSKPKNAKGGIIADKSTKTGGGRGKKAAASKSKSKQKGAKAVVTTTFNTKVTSVSTKVTTKMAKSNSATTSCTFN
jgi:hypothetical protein